MNNKQDLIKKFYHTFNIKLREDYSQLDIPLSEGFFNCLDFNVFLPSYNCNLQRDFVWTLEQKQMFILAVVLGEPIPAVTLIQIYTDNERAKNKLFLNKFKNPPKTIYEVIDGKQRLSTIMEFKNSEFSIKMFDEDVYYKDFPIFFERQTTFASIRANIFCKYDGLGDFDDDYKIDLFESRSFTGTVQEINHVNNIRNKKIKSDV